MPSNSHSGIAPKSTSLPMRTGNALLSNWRMGPAPERPSSTACHTADTSMPSEQTMDAPVTTTRRELPFPLIIGDLLRIPNHLVQPPAFLGGMKVFRGAQAHGKTAHRN